MRKDVEHLHLWCNLFPAHFLHTPNMLIYKVVSSSNYDSKYMCKAETLENEEKHTTINIEAHGIIT